MAVGVLVDCFLRGKEELEVRRPHQWAAHFRIGIKKGSIPEEPYLSINFTVFFISKCELPKAKAIGLPGPSTIVTNEEAEDTLILVKKEIEG